jgi:NitT/TauT family transport system permease protein
MLVEQKFHDAMSATLIAWFLTVAIGSIIAIPVGIVIGYFSVLYKSSVLVIHAGRSIPGSVLIPISILIFGLGLSMQVVLGVFSVFWILVLNTLYGVRQVEPQLVRVGKSLRWSKTKILRKVILPGALPSIATGIRTCGSIALIILVSIELLGASSGIGTLMLLYRDNVQPDRVYGSVVYTALLGAIIYSLLLIGERLAVPWSHGVRATS